MTRMAESVEVTELTRRVAKELRERAAALEMSRAEVGRRAGLKSSSNNQIFRGVKSPTLDELQALSNALGAAVVDVLIVAGRRA